DFMLAYTLGKWFFSGKSTRLPASAAHHLAAEAARPGNMVVLVRIAIDLQSAGEVDAAVACLRKAVTIDPLFGPAYYDLGGALRAKGALDGAAEAYRKTILLEGYSQHEARFQLGVILREQKKWEQAADCFREMIARLPMHARAHYNLGLVLKDQGDWDGAVA